MSLSIITKLIDYIPYNSINKNEYIKHLNLNKESILYTSNKEGKNPIIPFQVFTVAYKSDIVIETNHPQISMHEFAKLRVNNDDVWIGKDSTRDGVQTLTFPHEKYLTLFPEINVPRRVSPIEIKDSSTNEKLNITANYTNQFNEVQKIEFSSPRLTDHNLQNRTNGSTFNHSKDSVSALLDISHKNLKNISARVTYDGNDYTLKKVFKIFPVKALLRQTQVGFSSGIFTQFSFKENQSIVKREHFPDEFWTFKDQTLSSSSELRSISHYYNKNAELLTSSIFLEKKEIMKINFSAPLPDLNRSFISIKRNFVVFINGKGQGLGEIYFECDDNQCTILINPMKPRWFKSRPVQIKIMKKDRSNKVISEMIKS